MSNLRATAIITNKMSNLRATAIITIEHGNINKKTGQKNIKKVEVIPKLITTAGLNHLAACLAGTGTVEINYIGLFTNDVTVTTSTVVGDLTTDSDTWNTVLQSSSSNVATFEITLNQADGDLNIDTYYGGAFYCGANAAAESGQLFECYNSEREITAGDYLNITLTLTFTAA